jgi:hypothetical protein
VSSPDPSDDVSLSMKAAAKVKSGLSEMRNKMKVMKEQKEKAER